MIIHLGYAALPDKKYGKTPVNIIPDDTVWDKAIDEAATCPVDIPEEELAKIFYQQSCNAAWTWDEATDYVKEYFLNKAKITIPLFIGLMKAVRVEGI